MTGRGITVRTATQHDRQGILGISSQIWEGQDYVPELLDSWFLDDSGELVVAMLGDRLIAFAHRTWLYPGIAWFEGIRTDPAFRGRGAATGITRYLIESARASGADCIELSTHIDNKASIHIIESHGFRRVGSFIHVEREPSLTTPPVPPIDEASIRILTPQETVRRVAQSQFLSLAGGRFPRGWRFFPFARDPDEAVARLAYRLGYQEEDARSATLCIRQTKDHAGAVTLNFLDGSTQGMHALLHRALTDYSGKRFESMIPVRHGIPANAMPVLADAGFTSGTGFSPDVFAYQLLL